MPDPWQYGSIDEQCRSCNELGSILAQLAMDLILYPLLNLRSKRAILRKRKRWGHNYTYNPKYILLSRLSQETGLSIDNVRDQLEQEREWLLQYRQYYY